MKKTKATDRKTFNFHRIATIMLRGQKIQMKKRRPQIEKGSTSQNSYNNVERTT